MPYGLRLLSIHGSLNEARCNCHCRHTSLSLLLTRNWALLKNWRFYLPAIIVFVLAGPYYLWSYQFSSDALRGVSGPPPVDKLKMFACGLTLKSVFAAILIAIGVIALSSSLRVKSWVWLSVLASWAFGTMVVHLAVPTPTDLRYANYAAPRGEFCGFRT